MSITRFPLHQQWGHIASELERAISRQSVGDTEQFSQSIERILSMINEMTRQHLHQYSTKELLRFKEFILEQYTAQTNPTLSLEQLKTYSYSFFAT